jgi:hypothetical protein
MTTGRNRMWGAQGHMEVEGESARHTMHATMASLHVVAGTQSLGIQTEAVVCHGPWYCRHFRYGSAAA